MALSEQRARDLAFIEPPSSMTKIVQFAEQLSFGQESLFAGTDLPKPPISKGAFASQAMARKMSEQPYSMFPGANGEGLDTVMSRYTIRNRDIQDFTRWLMRWEDKRSELMVFQSPEQFFLERATPQMIEQFEADPRVEQIVREGRRRKRVVEEQQHEVEVEERVVRIQKSKEVRTVQEEVESPAETSAGPRPRRFGGHPKVQPEEPSYSEYWKPQPAAAQGGRVAAGMMGGQAVSAAAAAPMNPALALGAINKGIMVSNLGLGSLTSGIVKGRADAAASFQAQSAATSAVQSSPVAPYMQPEPYLQQPYGQQPFPQQPYQQQFYQQHGMPMQAARPGHSFVGQHQFHAMRSPGGSSYGAPSPNQYPSPDAYGEQLPGGRPLEISTDYPGSPAYRGQAPQIGEEDFIAIPRKTAESKGFSTSKSFRPSPGMLRGATVAIAAGTLVPFAFGGAGAAGVAGPVMAPLAYPGFAGVASQAFANGVAGRTMGAGPGQIVFPAAFSGAQSSAMPAGSMPRKDMFSTGLFEGAQSQGVAPMGLKSTEPPVRTSIPANPLMGQITLISPPMQVASQESEQAGSAVSFDIRKLAKGAGALDASGLAMLKASLPPGASAIYPALPQGSLGPQAVNMKLAPSLLGQILTQGYGPQAGHLAGPILSTPFSPQASDGAPPMEAAIVPTVKRPTDASAGVLGGPQHQGGPGAMQLAGAGESQRGGALDFLGMPVRLAPSLAGNAELRHEADAHRVMPPGAAGIIRPNEFGSMRSKLFPGFGTVHAEPDKGAWQKAAPSFGLADAQPHTILSPEARIKPPIGGAPIPQLEAGGHTPSAQALHAAGSFGAAAGLGASDSFDHAGLPSFGGHAALGGPAMPIGQGLGAMRRGTAAGGLSMGSGLGSLALAVHRPSFIGGLGGTQQPSTATSTRSFSTAGGSFSMPGSSRRPISRFTPFQPAIGLGPSGTTHTDTSPGPKGDGKIDMAKPGDGFSPRMAPVRGSSYPAIPDVTHSAASRAPSLTRPAFSTAGGGRPNLPPLAAPVLESTPFHAPAGSGSTPPVSASSSSSRRLPEMPIATSIPAKAPSSAFAVQRARHGESQGSSHGSSVHTQHDTEVDSPRDPGASAGEINLLANEVWSLLKRKLTFEAERLGRRF